MSLELRYSLPRGLTVKTSGAPQCGLGGVRLWIPVKPGEMNVIVRIAATDFVDMAAYVLTNTDLEPDDPRLAFVETVRCGRFVPEAGSKRRRFVAGAFTAPPGAPRVFSLACDGKAGPDVFVQLLSQSIVPGVAVGVPLSAPAPAAFQLDLEIPLEKFLTLVLAFLTGAPYEPHDAREPFIEGAQQLVPVEGHNAQGKRLGFPDVLAAETR